MFCRAKGFSRCNQFNLQEEPQAEVDDTPILQMRNQTIRVEATHTRINVVNVSEHGFERLI